MYHLLKILTLIFNIFIFPSRIRSSVLKLSDTTVYQKPGLRLELLCQAEQFEWAAPQPHRTKHHVWSCLLPHRVFCDPWSPAHSTRVAQQCHFPMLCSQLDALDVHGRGWAHLHVSQGCLLPQDNQTTLHCIAPANCHCSSSSPNHKNGGKSSSVDISALQLVIQACWKSCGSFPTRITPACLLRLQVHCTVP